MAGVLVVNSPVNYDQPAAHLLGGLARSGVAWSGVLTVGNLALSFAVTAILARILSPADYGLVGMVATLTSLVILFSDMGLSWATIQRTSLTIQQIHNLFWLNSGFGIVLAVLFATSSPLLAKFYGEPRIVPIASATAATFAIGGFAVQPMALLKRQMRFKQVAVVRIGAAAIGGGTGIALAMTGWGYWSLVGQSIASGTASLVLAFALTGYRPGRVTFGVGTRTLVQFGGLLAANGALIYVARNMDNILIGRFWGATELGYYSRAYFLMTLPNLLVTGVLSTVMVPALSALQHDRKRFGDAYRLALRLTALVGFPLAAGLGLVAPELIRIVYGPQWSAVVPIFAWLSVSAVAQPVFNTQGWLFTAAGKGKAYLHATLIYSALTAAAFTVGIHDGAVGVARSYSIVFVTLITSPILYLAHRAADLDFRPSLLAIAPAASATVGMVAAVVMLEVVLREVGVGWAVTLAIKVLVAALCYGAIILTLDDWARSLVQTRRIQLWPRSST